MADGRPMALSNSTLRAHIVEVLRAGAVRTVFQPIVDLHSGSMVAVEALSRGPAGTDLEAPDALFAAAAESRWTLQLDQLCIKRAMRAARSVNKGLAVFTNAEPQTLAHPSTARLLGGLGEQLMIEVTERHLARDPAGVLRCLAYVRAVGAGVALDDLGADPASTAFLSFVQPDVIKLDMALIQGRPNELIGQVATAVWRMRSVPAPSSSPRASRPSSSDDERWVWARRSARATYSVDLANVSITSTCPSRRGRACVPHRRRFPTRTRRFERYRQGMSPPTSPTSACSCRSPSTSRRKQAAKATSYCSPHFRNQTGSPPTPRSVTNASPNTCLSSPLWESGSPPLLPKVYEGQLCARTILCAANGQSLRSVHTMRVLSLHEISATTVHDYSDDSSTQSLTIDHSSPPRR